MSSYPWTDAMVTTQGLTEEDAVYHCCACQRDTWHGITLREGRVLGLCEWCQQRSDFTP